VPSPSNLSQPQTPSKIHVICFNVLLPAAAASLCGCKFKPYKVRRAGFRTDSEPNARLESESMRVPCAVAVERSNQLSVAFMQILPLGSFSRIVDERDESVKVQWQLLVADTFETSHFALEDGAVSRGRQQFAAAYARWRQV
jgi:hypothetical protein